MTDTFTTRLRIRRPEVGANDNTWGTLLNEDVFDLIDTAIAGTTTVNTTGGVTVLNNTDGESVSDEARAALFTISGTLTSNAEIHFPDSGPRRVILVRNTTTGPYTVTVRTVSGGGTSSVIPQDGGPYLVALISSTAARPALIINGALLDKVQQWTAAQVSTPVALSDAATVAIDLEAGNNFTLTAAGNRTLGNPTNPVVGQYFDILIVGNSTTDRTITFGSNYRAPDGALPTVVVDNTKACLLSFRVAASNRIMVIGAQSNFDLT